MRSYWKLRERQTVCGRRLPLPPQQLMVVAAALSLTAMAVSLMTVAGGLSRTVPGEEEAKTCNTVQYTEILIESCL